MKSLKMDEDSILALVEELRALRTVPIMPKESAFDEYIPVNQLLESNNLLSSKILKESCQGE